MNFLRIFQDLDVTKLSVIWNLENMGLFHGLAKLFKLLYIPNCLENLDVAELPIIWNLEIICGGDSSFRITKRIISKFQITKSSVTSKSFK